MNRTHVDSAKTFSGDNGMSSDSSNPGDSSSDEESNHLINLLRSWGIRYLVGWDYRDEQPSTDRASLLALVQRLARCKAAPRVRDASISLYLLHPELAEVILEALQTSEPARVEELSTLVLATLYLQRLWSIRLALAFGHVSAFPEEPFAFLWQQRGLPPPAFGDGEWGLLALQEAEQRRTGMPLTFRGDWQNQMDHLLRQEEAHQRYASVSVTSLLEERHKDTQNEGAWTRPPLDKQTIESFLHGLGQMFHKAGQVYVMGEAALIHLGVRPGFIQDLEINVVARNNEDQDQLFAAVRQLGRQMDIGIEMVPFLLGRMFPLPRHWKRQARYIGRYGSIDAFYFDFATLALMKMYRGTTRDIKDVKRLLERGEITFRGLDRTYQKVLNKAGKDGYGWLDPQHFVQRCTAVWRLLCAPVEKCR